MSNEVTNQTRSQHTTYQKRIRVIHGVETWFDLDNETVLSVWLSNWTGREIIRINDQIIASHRSWQLESTHSFVYAGKQYSLRVKIEKFIQIRVELWRGDQLVDFDVVSNGRVLPRGEGAPKTNSKNILITLLMGIGLGMLGALFGYWVGSLFGA